MMRAGGWNTTRKGNKAWSKGVQVGRSRVEGPENKESQSRAAEQAGKWEMPLSIMVFS